MAGFEPATYSFISHLNFANAYMRIRLYLAHTARAAQRPLSVVRAGGTMFALATVLAFVTGY